MKHFAARALRRLRLYDRLNWTSRDTVRERSFAIPVTGGIASAVSEPWMVDLIAELMASRAGGFVDVGVNLGQTLIKVAAVAPGRDYVGFEPNPACVAYVEKLIAANALAGFRLVPVGVGEATGLLTLYLYGGATIDPAASIVADFRPGEPIRGEKIVPVFGYDDLKRLLPESIALLKIDVEGYELEVLRALRPAIEASRPNVLIEVLPAYRADNRVRIERQQAIEALIGEWDYALFRVRHRGEGALEGVERLDSFGIHGDLDRCDYVLAPAERVRAMERWLA